MPQFIALEWDNNEARVAVASSKGDRITVEQAFSVALLAEAENIEEAAAPTEPGKEKAGSQAKDAAAARAISIGKQIAAAMSERGVGHHDALVAVGRSTIELRQLSMPPVPDEELPDAVRFQAMREFNALDEDWPLDFLALDNPEEGPRSVLAAAIDPAQVALIQKTCHAIGVKPQNLLLRPCAAASLFGRAQGAETATLRMLVDLLTDEVDLTVMIDRRVVFLRSTRLPAGNPLDSRENATALVGEIRRTMVAAMNTLGGQRVESIVLCGKGEKHAALAKIIEESLGMPAAVFDPFEGLELSRELQDNLPEFSGRFAPVLGMLATELEETGHAIDFLHPHKRPIPPSRMKYLVAAGAVVGVLFLGWLGYGWFNKIMLRNQIADADAQIKKIKDDDENTKKLLGNMAKIDEWKVTDIAVLDEMSHLSKNLPARNYFKATSFSFNAKSTKGTNEAGIINLQGMVSRPEVLEQIEAAANTDDGLHIAQITSQGTLDATKAQKERRYTWDFSLKQTIYKPETSKSPTAKPAPAGAAAKKTAPVETEKQ
jgi:Tfp pilus assembly PilM family ATPase